MQFKYVMQNICTICIFDRCLMGEICLGCQIHKSHCLNSQTFLYDATPVQGKLLWQLTDNTIIYLHVILWWWYKLLHTELWKYIPANQDGWILKHVCLTVCPFDMILSLHILKNSVDATEWIFLKLCSLSFWNMKRDDFESQFCRYNAPCRGGTALTYEF